MHVLAQISTMTHLKSNNLWQKWRQQTKKKLCWLKGAKRHLNIFNSQWLPSLTFSFRMAEHHAMNYEEENISSCFGRRSSFQSPNYVPKDLLLYMNDQSPPVSFVVCLLAQFGALYVIMRRFLQTLFKFSLSLMSYCGKTVAGNGSNIINETQLKNA